METPAFYVGGYFDATSANNFSTEKRVVAADQKTGENFTIEDLLDFSNDDAIINDGGFFDNVTGNSTNSSTGTCNSAVSGCDNTNNNLPANTSACRSSGSFADSQFSGELCVPYDDLAELEWLSNFVEDSFSMDQALQKTHLEFLSGSKPLTPESSSSSTRLEPVSPKSSIPVFLPESPFPGKARSKRSRAAPCDWSTRLLHVSPKASSIKQENSNTGSNVHSGTVRKCLHCATEKTPQWRTGPMGSKTLCNACGVRYKSGRLVPEYRPAASPTFVSAKHSNSHRKVLELRRQRELQMQQQQQFLSQSSIFGVPNGGDDYLIHHHTGHDFRHMI